MVRGLQGNCEDNLSCNKPSQSMSSSCHARVALHGQLLPNCLTWSKTCPTDLVLDQDAGVYSDVSYVCDACVRLLESH